MSRREFELKQGNMPNWQGRNMPPPLLPRGGYSLFRGIAGCQKKIYLGPERIDLFRNSDLLGPRGDLGPRFFMEIMVHLGF